MRILGHLDANDYEWILDIVEKSLWILSFFLSDLVGGNVIINQEQNLPQGQKWPNSPNLYTNSGITDVISHNYAKIKKRFT